MPKYNILLMSIILTLAIDNTYAQEKNNITFRIKEKANITDLNQYITAMEKANFSCYYYKNKRRELKFDSGLIIELFSATEIEKQGITINYSCLPDENKNIENPPQYSLSKGYIIEKHFETIGK
jgi:hypothetical protein